MFGSLSHDTHLIIYDKMYDSKYCPPDAGYNEVIFNLILLDLLDLKYDLLLVVITEVSWSSFLSFYFHITANVYLLDVR